jgi:O-antigen ligase
VWDRYNLNRAALNMVEQRPLVGFGWGSFAERGTDFFQQGPDYPLSAGVGTGVHSAIFSHLAELGLIGTFLWGLSTIFVPAAAILRRGPPELDSWRAGLLAYTVFWWVVANFIYPYMFSVLILWVWSGLLWGAAGTPARSARAQLHLQQLQAIPGERRQ